MTQAAALRVVGLVLVIAIAAFLLLNMPGEVDERTLWIGLPVLVIGFVGVVVLKRIGKK